MTHAKQELTIAVAATFAAAPLEEPLAHWVRELGLSAQIRLAPYGQVFQPRLDASGLFLTNRHGLNVLRVFDYHPRTVLRRERIASWRLNGARKWENLKSIADELDLATDNLIFVDDNPVECAEIRTELPEIQTVRLLCRAATELADVRQVLENMELKRRRPGPPATGADCVPPRTRTEKVLCEIWSGLLGIDPVGTHHNFFDIGRHSLLATRVLSRIHDRFGVELSTQAVFDAPTIAELAAMVEIRQIEGAEPQEVLAMMREFDSLMDEQVETLLSREGSEP